VLAAGFPLRSGAQAARCPYGFRMHHLLEAYCPSIILTVIAGIASPKNSPSHISLRIKNQIVQA
jgi:hypothetical protein